jgi:hypothetical protein
MKYKAVYRKTLPYNIHITYIHEEFHITYIHEEFHITYIHETLHCTMLFIHP